MSSIRQPAKGERAGAFSGEGMGRVWRGIFLCQAGNGRKSGEIWRKAMDSDKMRAFLYLGLAKAWEICFLTCPAVTLHENHVTRQHHSL